MSSENPYSYQIYLVVIFPMIPCSRSYLGLIEAICIPPYTAESFPRTH
jgi:hypothetical protein